MPLGDLTGFVASVTNFLHYPWWVAGSLVGLTAFGAPLLIETLLPKLKRYASLFQVRAHVRRMVPCKE